MGEFSPFTTGRGPSLYFVIPSLKPFGKFSPWKLDGIGEPFSGPANFKGLLMLVLGRVFLYKTCGNIDPWTCQMFVSFVILYVCGKLQDADIKLFFWIPTQDTNLWTFKMVHLKNHMEMRSGYSSDVYPTPWLRLQHVVFIFQDVSINFCGAAACESRKTCCWRIPLRAESRQKQWILLGAQLLWVCWHFSRYKSWKAWQFGCDLDIVFFVFFKDDIHT